MGKLPALILVSFFTCFTITANAQSQLQLGTPIERTLGPGQVHEFTVKVEENNFVQVVVDQRGIDVTVKIISPANKSLGDFDSPNGNDGPENISFVAVAAGSYRITVAPLDPGGAPEGRYEIKLLELRRATDQELKSSKNLEVVKAKGLALLSEIEGLIPQIKSPQNRIKTQLEVARLLWESDEKRASKHVSEAMAAFKELFATVDTNSQRYFQQYPVMSELRNEIIQCLVARDPDAALTFLYSTIPLPDPNGNQQDQLSHTNALELMIADQIMQKDPNRALQIARKNLKKGFSANLSSTLSQLSVKNPEIAAELANEITGKLLNEKFLKNHEAANLAMHLIRISQRQQGRFHAVIQNTGVSAVVQNPGVSKAPLLPDDKYKELFQKIFNEALSYSPSSIQPYGTERDSAWNMLTGLQALGTDLDTIVTGGTAAVEKKLAELSANPQAAFAQEYQTAIANSPTDAALEAIEKAPQELKEQLYVQLAGREAMNGDSARARQIINDRVSNLYQRRQALQGIEQQEIYRAITKGKIEEALRAVSAFGSPRERAAQLAQIASQIGPGHKRASAINLLEQARSMLGPSLQARDEDHMRALFEIARAYSRYDSKRAFEIIDPLIDQLNDLCTALRTLEGFGNENYQDDELNLGNGNTVANMAAQMSTVLGTLAFSDFEGAKAVADRVRLPEVRLRTYMEIAQQTIQGAK